MVTSLYTRPYPVNSRIVNGIHWYNSAIGVQLNGHGGVFGMLHSSVTLCSNSFTHNCNTAIQSSGGVIFSQRTNITSDANIFTRNSAVRRAWWSNTLERSHDRQKQLL